jgi:hypothetical protein
MLDTGCLAQCSRASVGMMQQMLTAEIILIQQCRADPQMSGGKIDPRICQGLPAHRQ